MPATTPRTADLGQGWFVIANENGSFTIRNCDKGLRIDLTRESADRFVELWNLVAVARKVAP